ncbi:type IV toxin-antitoxin system AbiEi family antitoxin domain-containing protein [Streptomyces lavendulae]|uniref:type IV toxin-antitoxin system AbiEi family antitoxin domain-containing protein n=1 Tax=Streptomyces lavendulae TaxID=1914 RepID=UPI0036BC8316
MERSEAIRRLGAIAADQWGLATARQAQAAGVSRVDLGRLIDAELLLRAAHGVYQLVGGAPTSHLDIKAAWLRLDPGVMAWERPLDGDRSGVISHASACQLHDIGDIPADDVEISVPVRRTTRENGVTLHKSAIPAGDITLVDGLPVTTVDRTICDLLRGRADGGHVGRVLADADQRGLTDTRVLADRVQPYARAYGLPQNAKGSDLLNFLAEQAGFTLRDEQLTAAGERAVGNALREAAFAAGTAPPGMAAVLAALSESVRPNYAALAAGLRPTIGALAAMSESMKVNHAALAAGLHPMIGALAALSESVRPNYAALAAGLRPIEQLSASVVPRASAEAMRQALERSFQGPSQAYLDTLRSTGPRAAATSSLGRSSEAAVAASLAQLTSTMPSLTVPADLLAQLSSTMPELSSADSAPAAEQPEDGSQVSPGSSE